MISVAPAMPPVKVHQCRLVPVPINATYQCPSELPFSVIHQCQCHLSMPISATYQCQSVLPINVHQCRLSVCISAA
ncbi:unnamed protein product [Staurois parvus]|nr:unnamed protein product [Staurois parvus]